MHITEHICGDRPTEANFTTFELFIKESLPEDYKSFLRIENGGRPKPNRFSFITKDGKREESNVHYFFALHQGKVGSIKNNFERYKNRIVSGYIPAGIDPFGNLIILGVTEESKSRIYFWDHEKEIEIPSVANMFFIANSFSEFVAQLF